VDGGKISFAPVVTDLKNRRGEKRDETREKSRISATRGMVCVCVCGLYRMQGGILEYEEFCEFSGD